MTPAERLVATAKAEVGYREKASNSQLDNPTANAGTANWNKYAAALDKTDFFNGAKNGYDWCAVFVCWCFVTAFGIEVARKITGIPARSAAAGVSYLRQYFSQIGGLVSDPQPGDVIFFKTANGAAWQHTGIVTKVADGCVETVEGNAGTPQGVNTFRYALGYNRIGGYGRAKWSLVPDETTPAQPAQPVQPVQPETGALSYEQWKEYMERYRKELQAREGSTWSEAARNWAIQTGLVSGSDAGYMWQDFLTREQAAALFQKYGKA